MATLSTWVIPCRRPNAHITKGFAEDYDPGIVYYRNEIHFPEESDP